MSDGTKTGQFSWLNAIKAIGAVAGTVTGVLAVIFLLFPSAKPDEPPTPTPLPAEMRGLLSNAVVTPGTTWGFYAEQYGNADLQGRPAATLGVMIRYTVEIRGLVGRTCYVNGRLVDTVANQWVGETWQQGMIPEAMVDTSNMVLWIPTTVTPGTYHAILILYNQNGTELNRIATTTFTV